MNSIHRAKQILAEAYKNSPPLEVTHEDLMEILLILNITSEGEGITPETLTEAFVMRNNIKAFLFHLQREGAEVHPTPGAAE